MHQCLDTLTIKYSNCKKGKVLPYSLPSVVPTTDPGLHAVSPYVTKPSGRR